MLAGPLVGVAGQEVPDRHREAQLAAMQHVRRHDQLHRPAQRELGGLLRDLLIGRYGPGHLEHLGVQERHPQLQRVRHRHLVGLDQDVAAQPGEQIDVLHTRDRVRFPAERINGVGDVPEGALRIVGPEQSGQLLLAEDPRVSVIPVLEFERSPAQHVLTAEPLRQSASDGRQTLAHPVRQSGDPAQAGRLAVDVVPAEQLVGAFPGQHHLDVLSRLVGDEVQRHQGRVGHRVVEVPDDQRQRLGQFLLGDRPDDVPDADRLSGRDRSIDFRETLPFEPGGERDQVGVVALGECRDCRRVDAAGQESAHRHVCAHVLGHRVVHHGCDALVQRGALGVGDRRPAGEYRMEIALVHHRPTGAHRHMGAGLDLPDGRIHRGRLRNVLQDQVVLQRRDVHPGPAGQLAKALGLGRKADAVGCLGDEQRLDPERVASREQHAVLGVPDQESEHPAQSRDGLRTPVVEGGDDRFTVALGAELRAVLRGQFLAQFDVVVDLAVEDQCVPVGRLRRPPPQRLVRMVDVDDREPVEAEDDVAVAPGPRLVRPPVPRAHHPGRDRIDPRLRLSRCRDETHQSAHEVPTVLSRTRKLFAGCPDLSPPPCRQRQPVSPVHRPAPPRDPLYGRSVASG